MPHPSYFCTIQAPAKAIRHRQPVVHLDAGYHSQPPQGLAEHGMAGQMATRASAPIQASRRWPPMTANWRSP
jgi:hypothetical protein